MSDFDVSTGRKAEAYALTDAPKGLACPTRLYGFTAGRNSAKESLEIACRALLAIGITHLKTPGEKYEKFSGAKAREAIAKIREQNNWPIAEREGEK